MSYDKEHFFPAALAPARRLASSDPQNPADPEIEYRELTSRDDVLKILNDLNLSETDVFNDESLPNGSYLHSADMASSTENSAPTETEIERVDVFKPDDRLILTTHQDLIHEFRVLEVNEDRVVVIWLSTIKNNRTKFLDNHYFIVKKPIIKHECWEIQKLGKRKRGKGRIMKTGKIKHIKKPQEGGLTLEEELRYFKKWQERVMWRKIFKKFKSIFGRIIYRVIPKHRRKKI